MIKYSTIFFLKANIVIIVGFFFYYFVLEFDFKKAVVLLGEPERAAMVPVGEISAGFSIKQEFSLLDLEEEVVQKAADVCINLLMANYSNRTNSGSIEIGIELDGVQHLEIVNAQDISDNRYYPICFDTIEVNDLIQSSSKAILVNGVDGVQGSSVTAWTTKDVTHGEIVRQPKPIDTGPRSLIFFIGYEVVAWKRNVAVFALLLCSALLLYSLYNLATRQGVSQDNQSQPNKPRV